MNICLNWKHLEPWSYLVAQKSDKQNEIRKNITTLEVFEGFLLNVEPNLVFLKIFNTEFDDIIIKFTNKNGRQLEIEDKANLALLVNK